MTAIFFTLTWQKIKLHHLIKAPSTRLHDIFFNPQLFLSGFGFRPLKHPVNAAYESASCLIRCAEWKFLNTLWIRNLVDGKSGYVFLSGEVTRSSLILYREYCIQEWQPRRMLCCQYSRRGILGTRENPDTCRIHVDEQVLFEYGYVWTWKILNPERKICGWKKIQIRVDGA